LVKKSFPGDASFRRQIFLVMKVVGVSTLVGRFLEDRSRTQLRPELAAFIARAGSVLIDKDEPLRLSWCCMLAGGHLLIEDAPGMGKTTLVKLIAQLFDLSWKRIQCTNDLLPADVTGGNIYDDATRNFRFMQGPIFANLVMADELNRASAKSQSAFLQAMEENAVTVDGETHALPDPFVLIATQNPLDSAGTNPLPESQLDRFTMSLSLGLPNRSSEKRLVMDPPKRDVMATLEPVMTVETLMTLRSGVMAVHVGERVADYILDLVGWIRERADGISPRTVLALTACSKAWAFGAGRDFVTPSDVQAVARAVLCHRLLLTNDHGFHHAKELVDAALKSVPGEE
jgi:MoxR-like ATPase